MSYVISVLNQKGGVGKTTIVTNLAHAFLRHGKRVLLVDSDPQGSARDWNEANKGELLPVIGLDRETLPTDLKAVSQGYDYIFIDGAPQIAKLAIAAVKCSDFILIPVQPSPYDIWATSDLIDIVKARQEITNGKPEACFVVSRSIKNTKLGADVKEALEGYGFPVLENSTTQRVAYPTTATEGKTVFSENPENSAALEINAIANELLERIEK